MKIPSWLVGLSLAANTALIATCVLLASRVSRSARAPAGADAADGVAATHAATTTGSAPADGVYQAADTPLRRLLATGDLRAMRDALVAAGLNEAEAKAVLRIQILDNQQAARAAIDRRHAARRATWWYRDVFADQRLNAESQADLAALDAEASGALASLFGPETPPPAADDIHEQARFLPEDKRLAVSGILRDYEALLQKNRSQAPFGSGLPSDDAKRQFIEAERQRDLAALLTPQELREFELRFSPTARQLQGSLTVMHPSLEEYTLIHDALADVNRRYDNRGTAPKPDDFWTKRRQAEDAAFEQIRLRLGEERYIDFALNADALAVQQLAAAAELHSLPRDTTRELWRLRDHVTREGKRIYDEPGIDTDDRRRRITELGSQARVELDRLVPAAARNELGQNTLVTWAEKLEQGKLTLYGPRGRNASYGL